MSTDKFPDDTRIVVRDLPGFLALNEGAWPHWYTGWRTIHRLAITPNWRRCLVAAINMDRQPCNPGQTRRGRLTAFFDLLQHLEEITDEMGPLSMLERECITCYVMGDRCA